MKKLIYFLSILFIITSTFFFVLFLKQDYKKNIKVSLILMSCFVVICLIFYKKIGQILTLLFENKLSQEIWKKYFNSIFSSGWALLFGRGLLAKELLIWGQVAENVPLLLFLLYHFGLIGCIFLVLIIHKSISLVSKDKPTIISWLPLVCIITFSFFNGLFKCYNIALVALAFIILFTTESEVNALPRKHLE